MSGITKMPSMYVKIQCSTNPKFPTFKSYTFVLIRTFCCTYIHWKVLFFLMLYIPVSAVVPVFVWIDPDEGVGEFFFFSSKFAFKNEYL